MARTDIHQGLLDIYGDQTCGYERCEAVRGTFQQQWVTSSGTDVKSYFENHKKRKIKIKE